MVGGVLAWALAGSGLQVLLVDRNTLAETASTAGERSTALSWGSCQLLESLGLWEQLAPSASPIEHIHVSQKGHLGTVRMTAMEHQLDALGYVLPNVALLECLAQKLPNTPNISLATPAQIESLCESEDSVQVTLDDGSQISAGLLVVAEGSNSSTRSLAGIDAKYSSYEQHAIVATLVAQNAPAATAWERFTADGPLALLPLPPAQDIDGQRLSLVLTVPEDALEAVLDLDDSAFLAHIQTAIGHRAGQMISVGCRQAFPLWQVQAAPSWEGRVLNVGNAARTLHPVAGQGFNLALRDIMTAAELLHNLAPGQDAGADYLRSDYLRLRQGDQRFTSGLTDTLARVFRGKNSLLGHLRGAGLIATDRLPVLKHAFARRSMGLSQRMPTIAAAPDQQRAVPLRSAKTTVNLSTIA